MSSATRFNLYALFILALCVHVVAWAQLREVRARWLNVPPVPSTFSASAFALADNQFAYRMTGLMLQNLGDSGGRVTAFRDYDYERLIQWFHLTEKLDFRSDFIPRLAAYYFSAVDDPQKLSLLADYLYEAGNSTEGDKWQWLAQAIYLKRYKANDLETAYQWSLELANMDKPGIPIWTKQMPAFIKNAEGDKQAAYDILVSILKSGQGKMPREEINAMTDYICTRILGPEEAPVDPLCQQNQ
jgi:hypothetical protein